MIIMELEKKKSGKEFVLPEPNSSLWHKGFIIIIFVSCLVNFGNFFVGNAFSYWIIDMGGTSATYGLVHGLFSAVCLIARPFCGWLADNGNRRVTFVVSAFVYVASMILMLITPYFGLFVALRLIQGLGNGGASTVITACSYDEIPATKMDKGIGYIALFSSLVTATTPALTISVYNKSGPTPLVIWAAIATFVGVGLSFFIAFRKPPVHKKIAFKDVFDLKQLFDVRCLKPAIPMALSVHLGMGVRSFVALYGRSLGFANPGWFSTVSAVGLIFVRLILDRVKTTEQFPTKRVYFAYGVFILYIVCIAFCKNLVMFYTAAVLWSVAFGILQPSFTSMIIRSVPEERRGVAASTTHVCGDIGMILGSTIGGFISDRWGYTVMFLLVIIPTVACCLFYRAKLAGKFVPYDQQDHSAEA